MLLRDEMEKGRKRMIHYEIITDLDKQYQKSIIDHCIQK